MALMCCILFAGCKKDNGGTSTGEDLSYLYKTYFRYESSNGQIIKQTWTYDGHKETSYKHYVDGLLYSERKNYSYDGLNASYDDYSYKNGDVNDVTVRHYECEYLDDTYLRKKYEKYYSLDPQDTNIHETYYCYDGKKKTSQKQYYNGVLTREVLYSYDGLRCSYKIDFGNQRERYFEVLYLDETFLRQNTYLRSEKRYDTEGNLLTSNISYFVYNYDGKKPIGYQEYQDDNLSAIGRDYQYEGLNCYYFLDDYQDGEVVSTRMYEVEYLE